MQRARGAATAGERGLGQLATPTARLPDSGSGHDDLETSLSISGLGRVTGVVMAGKKRKRRLKEGPWRRRKDRLASFSFA